MYTGAPPLTAEEIEALLDQPLTARLCSLNEDGTIHAAPIWYKHEGGRLVMVSIEASRKVRNVRRHPTVTVLVDAERPVERGVLIYGAAELEHDDVMATAVSIFERYVPKGDAGRLARGLFRLTDWVKITVKPVRMVSFDYGKDEAYRKAAWG